ncbi:MAG: hypothetical protein JO053_13660 [Acidobacteria bacterium]|nr:hypothetical protein [Acidobacteriota bacterium]
MLVRAIALSVALLIGIGVIVPLATGNAEAGPRRHRKHRRHYKKYSKQWWREYHRRQRRLARIRARKRAMRLKQLRLQREHEAQKADPNSSANVAIKAPVKPDAPATLPTGAKAPAGWKTAQQSPAELQFRVDNASGDQIGSASIAVVGQAVEQGSRDKSVGGIPTTSLRRDVIDKMIRENGWVVNDYQKEIGGQQVYVVVAQSQAKNGQVQSRMFYFTEVDGKIYSVATNSAASEGERLAEESEKVINSLKSRVRPSLRASVQN